MKQMKKKKKKKKKNESDFCYINEVVAARRAAITKVKLLWELGMSADQSE